MQMIRVPHLERRVYPNRPVAQGFSPRSHPAPIGSAANGHPRHTAESPPDSGQPAVQRKLKRRATQNDINRASQPPDTPRSWRSASAAVISPARSRASTADAWRRGCGGCSIRRNISSIRCRIVG